MAHAYYDGSPHPQALQDAFAREKYGIPLVAGGLLDQPFGRMRRMTVAKNVWDAIKAYSETEMSMAEYIKHNPELWSIKDMVDKVLRK